jgi:hypothetical protein
LIFVIVYGVNTRTSATVSLGVAAFFGRVLVGGIVGALLGVVTFWTVLAMHVRVAPTTGEVDVALSWVAAESGALIGCVMGPIALGIVVGRVPMWRATVHTATGTLVGAIALSWLWRIPPLAIQPGIWWSVIGGIVGCLLAAVRLRRAARVPKT